MGDCTAVTPRFSFTPATSAVCVFIFLGLFACMFVSCPIKNDSEIATINPNIAQEDFGTGITLLQTPRSAGSATGYSWLETLVLTKEELISRNPYGERPEGKDLVLAITSAYSKDSLTTGVAEHRVVELRVYPDPEKSKLTLQGQLLVELSPAAIEGLFGIPLSRDQGVDGNSHLSFLIVPGEDSEFKFRLVTSHSVNGRCFAASLALEPGK